MCDDARSKGIAGVPVIIIDGKWAISGGQSSDVFIQVSFFLTPQVEPRSSFYYLLDF